MAGTWYSMTLRSHDSVFHIGPKGTTPMWPHEDGVKACSPGDEIRFPFSTKADSVYGVYSKEGAEVARLPAGTYELTTRIAVSDSSPVRRLGLTTFEAETPVVSIEVKSD